MSKEKQYVQKCKIVEKQFDNGGSLLNCALHIDELKEMANAQGWVNITIAKRKEASPKGATHYAYKNEYEPKGQSSEAPKAAAADMGSKTDEYGDDIPF